MKDYLDKEQLEQLKNECKISVHNKLRDKYSSYFRVVSKNGTGSYNYSKFIQGKLQYFAERFPIHKGVLDFLNEKRDDLIAKHGLKLSIERLDFHLEYTQYSYTYDNNTRKYYFKYNNNERGFDELIDGKFRVFTQSHKEHDIDPVEQLLDKRYSVVSRSKKTKRRYKKLFKNPHLRLVGYQKELKYYHMQQVDILRTPFFEGLNKRLVDDGKLIRFETYLEHYSTFKYLPPIIEPQEGMKVFGMYQGNFISDTIGEVNHLTGNYKLKKHRYELDTYFFKYGVLYTKLKPNNEK